MTAVGRRAIAGVVVLAAIGGGTVIARADGAQSRAAATEGGMGISPVLIEKTAAAGPLGAITVYNNSKKALDVTLKARPWVQSASGTVSANRRRTLSSIELGEGSFTLAPGTKKAVDVTARSAGSLYGAIEVIGMPAGAGKATGVVTGYRLLSTLRLNPATPVLNLTAKSAKVTGRGSKRAVVLPVRNAGNTVQPISGDVMLKGPLGTRSTDIDGLRVLPGKTVNLLLSKAGSLQAGSYKATVKLKQGAKTTTFTKKLRIKKG